MQANRYDRAAEAPIMNTYVPIDFKNLYLIGAHQQEAVNKAADQLNTAIQKFGEFYSPSDVDTENWYKLTLGNPVMNSVIEEARNNPDIMKDAGWRARLNAGMMSVDYGALGRLKAGKENMLLREKANQELMARGGYNPLLHDVDFRNYNTLDSGIFSDISPLAYQSTVDMVKPFVDNLKGRYLGKHDGFIFNGVANEDTDAQVAANWSSIVTSPHYAQNLQLIKMQNPGISDEEAVNELNRQIYTAGREFAWNKTERDPLDLIYQREAAKAAARGDNEQPNGLQNFIPSIYSDAMYNFYENRFKNILSKDRGDITNEEKTKQISDEIRNSLHDFVKERIKNKVSIHSTVEDVLDYLGANVSSYGNETLETMNTSSDKNLRIGGNSSDAILAVDFVRNVAGSTLTSQQARDEGPTSDNLRNALRNGRFDEFIVKGDTRVVTDGSNLYHTQSVYIPEDKLKSYTNAQKSAIAAKLVNLDEDDIRTTMSVDQYGQVKTSTSKHKAGKYYKIPIVSKVPLQGEAAEGLNTIYTNKRKGSTKMTDYLYQRSQAENYNYITQNEENE